MSSVFRTSVRTLTIRRFTETLHLIDKRLKCIKTFERDDRQSICFLRNEIRYLRFRSVESSGFSFNTELCKTSTECRNLFDKICISQSLIIYETVDLVIYVIRGKLPQHTLTSDTHRHSVTYILSECANVVQIELQYNRYNFGTPIERPKNMAFEK